jgi:biotin carboxylase
LDAALEISHRSGSDVLFPTQEQVAVLSACADLLHAAGVRSVVPSFSALARLQDKVSASRTLRDLGLPQPAVAVLLQPSDAEAWDRFPLYVKSPIGTATTGVRLASDASQLARVVADASAAGTFDEGGLLAQEAAEGPLAMVQAVFAEGDLVASHANLRVHEGARGGASHKRSVDLPLVREHLRVLGAALAWHGALSADVILTRAGPVYIDINPRLVEPGNAMRSGVDLVSPMLELAVGQSPPVQAPGQPDVSTHQLLLAVLGAAQRTLRRRAALDELIQAARHSGDYEESVEELTPTGGDWRAAIPLALSVSAIMIHPSLGRFLSAGSVRSYALSPAGWRDLLRRVHVDAG